MSFFNTFRGRLLVILLLLIVATLGVQYYSNYLTQQENIRLRDAQAQALVAGIALGTAGLTSTDERVVDLIDRPDQTFLDEESRSRIIDIIIIDNQWRVSDSLNEDYWPTRNDDGTTSYRMLADLTDLPPLMEGARLGEDLKQFPNIKAATNSDDEAHAVPIETSRGRWYVMVLLRNDKNEAAWRAARPLLITLAVLSISTLITFWLVWRFSRPIANLSNAARRVAEGDLSVRVPDDKRSDEMGQLASRFNEMTGQLERSRELEAQLHEKNVSLSATPGAREWLAQHGFDPLMGARPMARVIQDRIKRPLADELLFGKLARGGRVSIDVKDGELSVEAQEEPEKLLPVTV